MLKLNLCKKVQSISHLTFFHFFPLFLFDFFQKDLLEIAKEIQNTSLIKTAE